jgi:hypothetical protein
MEENKRRLDIYLMTSIIIVVKCRDFIYVAASERLEHWWSQTDTYNPNHPPLATGGNSIRAIISIRSQG